MASTQSKRDTVSAQMRGIPRTYELPTTISRSGSEPVATEPPPWLGWAISIAIPMLAGVFAFGLTAPFAYRFDYFMLPPFAATPLLLAAIALPIEALMGAVYYMIRKMTASARRTSALGCLIAQAALHYAWPLLLFHFGWLLPASLGAVLLAVSVHISIDCLAGLHRVAAWMLLPHFLFGAYLAYLSTAIALLN